MAASPTYLGAVSSSVGQALLTGAWIASGGLPAGRRRAVRLAATGSVVAVALLAERERGREGAEVAVIEAPDADQVRRGAAAAAGIVFGLGMIAGRRQVEKRWLARLQRNGHEHPYRALALRMGLLSLAGSLPAKLLAAHEARAGDTGR